MLHAGKVCLKLRKYANLREYEKVQRKLRKYAKNWENFRANKKTEKECFKLNKCAKK